MMLEIVSRAEARSSGLKRFFTGIRCPRGHVVERSTANGGCLECARNRSRSKPDEARAAKRVYDRTELAKKAKAERRARAGQKIKTKEYNTRHYEQFGRQRNGTEASIQNRAKYALSAKGRAMRAHKTRQYEIKKRGQMCTCCTSVEFRKIYEFAQWLDCEVDHRIPVAMGGAHCCHNLQVLTPEDHKAKTRRDTRLMTEFRRAFG